MNKFQYFRVVVLLLSLTFINCIELRRSRRFLRFPPAQPTRIQIIAGIGIPVSLELESVTIGYVFKAQFFLPENASNFWNPLNDPFELSTQPITGINRNIRSIERTHQTKRQQNAIDKNKGFDRQQNERFEKYQVETEVIENGTETMNDYNELYDDVSWIEPKNVYKNDLNTVKIPQYFGTSRFSVYKGMAAVAERKGLSGKACVLRSICESAHIPFDYSNGILGEMMHVIMSPSTTNDSVSDYTDYEYYHAEKLGKEGAPCENVFKECKRSILDEFTGVYKPIIDLLQKIVN